jgi:hypothetical protein
MARRLAEVGGRVDATGALWCTAASVDRDLTKYELASILQRL